MEVQFGFRNYAQKSKKNFVVADFVCPLPEQFKIFKPNFIVWMDTIKKGRFQSMNKLFKKPKKFNIRLTEKKLDINLLQVIDKLFGYKWKNKDIYIYTHVFFVFFWGGGGFSKMRKDHP